MQDGFRIRPNELLKKDPEIYGIVNDCLKDEHERPPITEVYKRLNAWSNHDTPEL